MLKPALLIVRSSECDLCAAAGIAASTGIAANATLKNLFMAGAVVG
jgi:hypothetical protein